jgi:hypothetical protein
MQAKINLIALGAAVALTVLVFIGTILASNNLLAWVATLSPREQILLQASNPVVLLVAVLAGVAWRRWRRIGTEQ